MEATKQDVIINEKVVLVIRKHFTEIVLLIYLLRKDANLAL